MREINELDPYLSEGEELDEIAAILTKEIARDTAEGTPVLASSNKDIVLAAVKKCGLALQFASEELQADKEIVKMSNLIAFTAPSNKNRGAPQANTPRNSDGNGVTAPSLNKNKRCI